METDRTVAPLVQISVGMWNDLLNRIAEIEDRLSPPDAAADPKPPTLREQVAEVVSSNAAIRGVGIALGDAIGQGAADAVLAVVADWLAAQPVHDGTAAGLWALEPRLAQRANDVRLLRGES